MILYHLHLSQKSIGVVGSLIMLVLGIVVSIYIIRFTIKDNVGRVSDLFVVKWHAWMF